MMEETTKKPSKIEELSVEGVSELMNRWGMNEFVDMVVEKRLDGLKLMDVTEGIVKLWRPRESPKKLIAFIQDLKDNPDKFFAETNEKTSVSIECQYQTVKKTKSDSTATMSNVEELFKKLVPPKSFLYRNQIRRNDKITPSYLPMDRGAKKPKPFFRLSSYEYPKFDFLSRLSKTENVEDRGYYAVKTNSSYYVQKTVKKQETKTKYKSLSAAEEMEKYPEDHFYEDLYYNDTVDNKETDNKPNQIRNVKPCIVKIQELFQSFKMPFFKKTEEVVERDKNEVQRKADSLYENTDFSGNMYDSVQVVRRVKPAEVEEVNDVKIPVEEYLEPVQLNKDYCDVGGRQKDESLLGYIMSLFESKFGIRRVNEEQERSSDVEAGGSPPPETYDEDPPLDNRLKNGNPRILQRIETVPDIKKDTSGITTQYIATGIVNLGAFAAGACISWSSSALPLLDNLLGHGGSNVTTSAKLSHTKLELWDSKESWTASLLCLGAACGAIPTGLISQYFGRKKTLLYLALPLVVSWLLVASSPNVYGLYVGRFVGGLAVGAFSVGIPPYVEDISEEHTLSTLANFYHVELACGVLFGYVVGMVSSIAWLSFLCASIPIAFFIAFIFLPESPAYLMSQGKYNEAKAALCYFRGIDNNIDAELKEIKENMKNYAKLKVTFRELFSTRATVKALVVSFGLMVFQQMSGIYPVLFYAQYIFNTFSVTQNLPTAAIILGFCLVSATYFSTMLLKTVRRRVLLMISFASMAISLGSFAMYFHLQVPKEFESGTWIPLFTLSMFVSVYAAGVGPIPWLMLREIFPRQATRRATAIAAGFHWFLAFSVTKMFQHLVKRVGSGWALWYFASVCVIGLIFVYFFVPETKGRSLEEIQNEFEGIHKKRKHRHVIEVESVSDA